MLNYTKCLVCDPKMVEINNELYDDGFFKTCSILSNLGELNETFIILPSVLAPLENNSNFNPNPPLSHFLTGDSLSDEPYLTYVMDLVL